MARSRSKDLPSELVEEILYRLPVNSLMQLRRVCKSWNSLISDPKFAKKHLHYSHKDITRHRIVLSRRDQPQSLRAYPLVDERHSSIFSGHPQGTPLRYPRSNPDFDFIIGSCDGILCFAGSECKPFLLWNPSIGKFKELPPLGSYYHHHHRKGQVPIYGFGYDHNTDHYNVIAGFCYKLNGDGGVYQSQVSVINFRTEIWRRKRIQNIPGMPKPDDKIGRLVSGTVNWLMKSSTSFAIVSFDLGTESFREISQPNYGVDSSIFVNGPGIIRLKLEVLRDCLSIIAGFYDYDDQEYYECFWVMKEYGNKESWTKLFKIPHFKHNIGLRWHSFARIVCILKDSRGNDVLFLRWGSILVVHSSTLTVYNCNQGGNHGDCMFKSFKTFIFPGSYVESLISPCI